MTLPTCSYSMLLNSCDAYFFRCYSCALRECKNAGQELRPTPAMIDTYFNTFSEDLNGKEADNHRIFVQSMQRAAKLHNYIDDYADDLVKIMVCTSSLVSSIYSVIFFDYQYLLYFVFHIRRTHQGTPDIT